MSFFVVSTAFAQTPPSDAQRAEARARYENGTRKFDVGKYDEAAHEFETAYEIVGAPEILFNIAQSLRLAGKYERALLFYRNYLRRKENPDNRAEVDRRIIEVQDKLAEQQRQNEQAQAAQAATAQPTAPVAATVAPTVEVTPPPVATPRPLPRWLKPLSATLLAVGVAGIGAGVGLSLLAKSESDDVQKAAAAHQTFDNSLLNKQKAGQTYDAAAIAAYAVGGVLAVGGAVGLTLALRHHGGERAVAALTPTFGPTSAGLQLAGSF